MMHKEVATQIQPSIPQLAAHVCSVLSCESQEARVMDISMFILGTPVVICIKVYSPLLNILSIRFYGMNYMF